MVALKKESPPHIAALQKLKSALPLSRCATIFAIWFLRTIWRCVFL